MKQLILANSSSQFYSNPHLSDTNNILYVVNICLLICSAFPKSDVFGEIYIGCMRPENTNTLVLVIMGHELFVLNRLAFFRHNDNKNCNNKDLEEGPENK